MVAVSNRERVTLNAKPLRQPLGEKNFGNVGLLKLSYVARSHQLFSKSSISLCKKTAKKMGQAFRRLTIFS